MSLFFFLTSETIQPILPLYITQKGATTFELGIIVSLLSFVAIATKIPLGILSERMGRWPIIPAVAIGQTASLILYSIVPDVIWFYPIRIFHALVIAAFPPTVVSIALDLAPSGKRGDIMGKFLTSVGVATMLGPFLCTFIVSYLNYVQLFRLASIIPLLGLATFILTYRKTSRTLLSEKRKSGFLAYLKNVASSRNMLVLSYLRLVFSFTNAFFITLFAVHAEDDLLLAPSLIALLFGVKGIVNMLSRVPSGRLADRIGYRLPLLLAYALLTFSYVTISETSNIHLLIFAMTIYGLAHGMSAVTEWSLLGDCSPSGMSNIASAYLSTMFNIGTAFGALVAGALSLILNIQTIFRLVSLISLTCLAVSAHALKSIIEKR